MYDEMGDAIVYDCLKTNCDLLRDELKRQREYNQKYSVLLNALYQEALDIALDSKQENTTREYACNLMDRIRSVLE